MQQHTYDIVVVGGGAAGLSAALVFGRARRTVAVVDADEPRNAPAAHIQGFLSRDGMPPSEFLAVGRAEVQHYDGVLPGLGCAHVPDRRPLGANQRPRRLGRRERRRPTEFGDHRGGRRRRGGHGDQPERRMRR